MKTLNKERTRRPGLGRITSSTLGDVKGVIEAAGLYTPAIALS